MSLALFCDAQTLTFGDGHIGTQGVHGGGQGGAGWGDGKGAVVYFIKSNKITSPPIFNILFTSIKISLLSKKPKNPRFLPGT